MNSAKLKETIANIVKEESEYQVFFRKALEKAGKSIPSMSDEEKKAFFNKIDKTWDGKGEKNEGNAFGAAVVAAKKAGEDEFEVGGKTFKVESVNEGRKSKDGAGVRYVEAIYNNINAIVKLVMDEKKDVKEVVDTMGPVLINAIKAALTHNYKPNPEPAYTLKRDLQRLGDLSNQQRIDVFKKGLKELLAVATELVKRPSQVGVKKLDVRFTKLFNHEYGANIGLNGQGPHANTIIESVNEGVSPTDMAKIKGAVEAASSFMNVGSELKKLGMKYTFATEPLPIYIIQPTPNNKVAIVNKKYATKPDFVVGDIAVGIMEGKLNEEEIKWNVVQNAIINFLKMNTKILDKRVQAKDTEGTINGLKSIISGLTNAQRSLKLESVNEAGYTVKGKTPYEFVNGAYAVLTAYLRDEELGPKGKRELQDIIKSLEYMRKYFYFKMSESVNEGKFKKDDLVYNKRTKTIGIVRMGDDKYGEVKTDADGNVNVDELEIFNPFKFKHQTNGKAAPSTEKEVNSRGLFNPFRQKESVNEERDSNLFYVLYQKKDGKFSKPQAAGYTSREDAEKFAKSLNNHSTMILDKTDFSGVKGVKVTNESVNEASTNWETHFKGFNEKELKVIQKFILMNPKGIDGVIEMSKKKDFKPFIQKAAKSGLGESVNEAKDDFVARYGKSNILLKKGYKHHTADELEALYDKVGKLVKGLNVKDVNIVFESVNEAFKHIIHVDTPTQVVSKPVAAQIMALAKKGIRSKEIGLEMGFTGNAKLAADTFQKVKSRIYFELDKRESVNEDVSFKDGKYHFYSKSGVAYLTYNGLIISSGDFDRGAYAYFMSHSSFKGQKAFDDGKDVITYFKKNRIVNEDVETQLQKIASLTGLQPQAIKQFGFLQGLNFTKILKFIENGKLKDRMDFVTAVVGNPGNPIQKKMIKMFQESVNEGRGFINAARKAKLEGKTEFEFNGKKYPITLKEGTLNEMNPQFNKKVKTLLDKELKDLRKGGGNHLFAVMHILMGALTDANFHSDSKKVPALFGSKAKYEGDPMAEKDLIQMYQYDLGTDIANICKWDGKDIVDAIGFYVSMTIGRPMGEKIENLIA